MQVARKFYVNFYLSKKSCQKVASMNKTNSTLNPLFTWHIPEGYLPYSRARPKFTTPAVSNTSRLFNFFITEQNCCYIPFHQNKGSLMNHHRLYFSIECSIKSFHIVLRMIDHFCVYDPLIKTTSPLSLLKSCLNIIWIHITTRLTQTTEMSITFL